jgi:Zn-dependent protease/tetratricopeptide (TPR) repeat protein
MDLDSPAASPGGDAGPSGPKVRRGLAGGIALLVVGAKSLLALLKLGPLLATFGSMAVFVWAEAVYWGWPLAAGFAVSIFLHEMGHVVMNWRHGLKFSAPMFIPFAGAVIAVKQFPADPTVESECGAGGPVAGALAALACLGLGAWTHQGYWFALAFLGFAINLFNLVPFWQLDGARVSTAFSPANWDFILVTLLLVVIKAPSVLLWVLLAVLFLLRLGRAPNGRYHLATPLVRARMALVYLALCLGLCYGADRTRWARPAPLAERAAAAAAPSDPAPSRPAARAAADRPAGAERTVGSASPRRRRPSPVGKAVILTLLWVAATVGWLLVSWLLAAAAGKPLQAGLLAPAGWMSAGFLAVCGVSWPTQTVREGMLLPGAYFAALGAAFVFSAYSAAHAQGKAGRMPHAWLTWRCLAWAGAAALAVAYGAESLWVLGAVFAAAAVFYARRPWLLLSLAARLAGSMGWVERAIALRWGALALGPRPEAAFMLLYDIAASYLSLGRGGEALAALDATAAGGAPPAGSFTALTLLAARAAALIRLERFEEALRCCEEMLRAPQGDLISPWRPLLVHRQLGELALYRSWPDEAQAQAECVLRGLGAQVAGLAGTLAAGARWVRASACVAEGRVSEGQRECEKALATNRDPATEARIAVVRAQAALLDGDWERAEKETGNALRRLPGSLETLYWRGRVLREAGNVEGETILRRLAAEFPREHWGILARAALPGT